MLVRENWTRLLPNKSQQNQLTLTSRRTHHHLSPIRMEHPNNLLHRLNQSLSNEKRFNQFVLHVNQNPRRLLHQFSSHSPLIHHHLNSYNKHLQVYHLKRLLRIRGVSVKKRRSYEEHYRKRRSSKSLNRHYPKCSQRQKVLVHCLVYQIWELEVEVRLLQLKRWNLHPWIFWQWKQI